MSRVVLFPVLVVAMAILAGCPKQQAAPPASGAPLAEAERIEVRAYIPCGMIIPMRAVSDAFEAEHPNIKIVGIYDNAGIIYKRLAEKGEQADVVVSPGKTEMARMAEKGLIDAASRQTIGTFELVCITPRASTLKIAGPEDLKQCKTIAMPNPKVNSTGTSGQEALTKLGLWETLRPKMILPEHAIEAHTLVAGNKAEAGIAYKNCPLETNPDKLAASKVQIAFPFPADSYEPQPCLVALTTKITNPDASKAFFDYLTSAAGRKILAENGMTGCLDMEACAAAGNTAAVPAPAAPVQKAAIHVMAFYPGNEKHQPIRDLVMGLPKTYGPQVSAEFIDFTTDEGFKVWHDEKGLTCGAILINDEQTWSYERNGKVQEVTFKMAIDGEWTAADLHAVIKQLLQQKKPGA